MKAVGIRELKSRLSEYIRLARRGESVLVTDRGEVVAELRPPGQSPLSETGNPVLEALLRRGNVSIGDPNRRELYPALAPIGPPGLAQRMLDDERGEH